MLYINNNFLFIYVFIFLSLLMEKIGEIFMKHFA